MEMAGPVGPKTPSPSSPPGRAALDSANQNAIGFSCRSEYVRWVGLLELPHCHQSGEAAHHDGESEDQDGAAKGHVHWQANRVDDKNVETGREHRPRKIAQQRQDERLL